jgi:SAM-dependent methyltransferase
MKTSALRRVTGLLVVLAFSASLPAQDSLDRHITAFVEWRYAPGRTSTGAMSQREAINGFRAKLIAEGVAEAEARRIVESIERNWERVEGVRWDRVFADPNSGVNRQPNRWLVETVKGTKPAKALDIGLGSGRNSLYLAQQGWDVTAFDVAAASVERARKNAAGLGLTLRAVVESYERFTFGSRQWDLVVDTYEFFPVRLRNAQIRESLKPGGIWVIEGFEKTPQRQFGYESGELLKLLDGMKIVRYAEVEDIADFGLDFGLRKVPLIRAVAQKR